MTELLRELEVVVRALESQRTMLSEKEFPTARYWSREVDTLSSSLVRTHHAEIAEAVKDARRYRHLRDWGVPELCIAVNASPSYAGGETDAAIDAAIDAHNSAREVGE
jgi:hypothetical protein